MRSISKRYEDPLDVVWLNAATEMGMEVRRDASVFASWDGSGVLTIGTPETLDPDDCLAQMILHETCHALIEGPDAWTQPDWGLDITDPAQRIREYACLRVQAALTTPFGLREFLASTTTFRSYYDQLPDDPLEGTDAATQLARQALDQAEDGRFSGPLRNALRKTAEIAAVVGDLVTAESLWSLFGTVRHA